MSAYSSWVNPMDVYTSVVMAAIRRIIAFRAILAGSFGVLLFACLECHSGFNWEGRWQGERSISIVPGTPPFVANSLRRVTLTVKSNGEYELHASGVPSRGM